MSDATDSVFPLPAPMFPLQPSGEPMFVIIEWIHDGQQMSTAIGSLNRAAFYADVMSTIIGAFNSGHDEITIRRDKGAEATWRKMRNLDPIDDHD